MAKRSKHSLSNTKLFTHDMGNLIPCGLLEVLPGDTIQQSTTALLRCSPLLTPVMHPVDVVIQHYFVPNRLVWDDWEDFITGGEDGTSLPTFPTIAAPASTGFAVKSLGDYLGIPTGVPDDLVSALPFRGYAKIWNEYFRDPDLQDKLTIDTTDGADTTTNTTLQNVAWLKDYLTTARPWEQKGPAITIPLGSQAPVMGIGLSTSAQTDFPAQSVHESGEIAATSFANSVTASQNQVAFIKKTSSGGGAFPEIYTDLSGASAITVGALREALALQRFEEARARYGSRYVEYLRYLGVRSSDARLQRPEFLGGGRQTIQFSEVLQTAEGTNAVGTMRGHGIAAMRSNRFRRSFEEHGFVFSFMAVRPKPMYIDGLVRHWNRRTKEDFWQRELEHIGQQEVLNKEVRMAHATPEGVFGYSDRYAEYRGQESTISGEFRSTLNMWHFGRAFGSDPALNADFVKCVPTEVPFAVSTSNVLWTQARHSIQARRLVTGNTQSFIR